METQQIQKPRVGAFLRFALTLALFIGSTFVVGIPAADAGGSCETTIAGTRTTSRECTNSTPPSTKHKTRHWCATAGGAGWQYGSWANFDATSTAGTCYNGGISSRMTYAFSPG